MSSREPRAASTRSRLTSTGERLVQGLQSDLEIRRRARANTLSSTTSTLSWDDSADTGIVERRSSDDSLRYPASPSEYRPLLGSASTNELIATSSDFRTE